MKRKNPEQVSMSTADLNRSLLSAQATERERIIALIEGMMRTSIVIREGDTGVWLVLSDLLRDIRNPK